MMSELTHCPVLLEECIQGLHIRPDGVYVDGTLGRAGHSRAIAKRLTTGRLIAIDRDQAALDAAFRKYGPAATVLAMPHGGSTLPYLQDAGPDHSRT